MHKLPASATRGLTLLLVLTYQARAACAVILCYSVQSPAPQAQLSEESCTVSPRRLASLAVDHGLFKGRTLVLKPMRFSA